MSYFFLNIYRNNSEKCLLCYRPRGGAQQPRNGGKRFDPDSSLCYLCYGKEATTLCVCVWGGGGFNIVSLKALVKNSL